jgi:hypothetical protein
VRPSVHAVTAARRVQRTTPPHQIWSHTKTPPVAPWVVSGFISRSSGTNTVARVELGFSARAHPKPFSSSTENPGKDEATVSSHVTSTATSDDDATGTHKIADECLLQSETDATKVNPRKNLYMMFTCGVCETRAAKGFSRQAYENGVVIVRCPGCQNQHLVADHEGWFGDKGTIEDFLKLRGACAEPGFPKSRHCLHDAPLEPFECTTARNNRTSFVMFVNCIRKQSAFDVCN